jgi:hypothetical protein
VAQDLCLEATSGREITVRIPHCYQIVGRLHLYL